MTTFELNMLHTFIVRAKATIYVGSGQKLLPYRLGSHDLQFFDGDWAHHNRYLGESDFIVEEHSERSRILSRRSRRARRRNLHSAGWRENVKSMSGWAASRVIPLRQLFFREVPHE